MILILIFAEVLGKSCRFLIQTSPLILTNHSLIGLYGLIVALLMNSRSKASCT